jgi:hypothetical protein
MRKVVTRCDASHRGVWKMSLRTIGLAFAVVLVATAAHAFQEQTGGSSAPAATSLPAASSKPVELDAGSVSAKAPVGTEVRIPGLGKLGNLPKMDFGLELLYGAAETKSAEPPARDENRDDLTIRGTVKHSF